MIVGSFAIAAFTILINYQNTKKELYSRLTNIVNRNKISAEIWLNDYGSSEDKLILHFRKLKENNVRIGQTGEFVIGRQVGDSIEFLISSSKLKNNLKLPITSFKA
jgi:hypothetical protein